MTDIDIFFMFLCLAICNGCDFKLLANVLCLLKCLDIQITLSSIMDDDTNPIGAE